MNSNTGGPGCGVTCWIVAALAGLLGAVLLWVLGEWGFLQGAFAGIVICGLLGALLSMTMCGSMDRPAARSDAATAGTGATTAPNAADPAPAAATATAMAVTADSAPAAEAPTGAVTASSPGTGPKRPEPATRGDGGDGPTGAATASEPGTGARKPDPAPAADLAPAADPAPAAEATPDYDGDGVLEGTQEGTRPATLSAPRDGAADNLKEIKGVGPKLEKMLNGMGFWHFDQIANWTGDEVAWVNANLTGFKGRVSRDNWVEQAKILASGGETEFSKRVDKGDVY